MTNRRTTNYSRRDIEQKENNLRYSRHLQQGKSVQESSLSVALARDIKQHFLSVDAVFASEVPYGPTDRRADFLVVDKRSHAYEIKSDFDSLGRLPEQISDYVCTFDFVSVVTTDRHLRSVRSIVPSKVGLSVFDAGSR